MIESLPSYFGPIGLASIAGWMLAWAILLLFAGWSGRRRLAFRAALAVAASALVLGWVNSAQIARIEVDRSGEQEAMQAELERQRRIELDLRRARSPTLRFAEEDAEALSTPVGVAEDAAAPNVYARAAELGESDDQTPLYRRGGRVERDPGRRRGDLDVDQASIDTTDQGAATDVRRLPELDVIRANRFDHLNRLALRGTLLACLVAIGIDYVRRFNQAFVPLAPLPLAGRWMDGISPKAWSIWWRGASDDQVRQFLQKALDKGETFICLSERDPFAGVGSPLRRRLWGLAPWRDVTYERLPPGTLPMSPAWLFEMSWFGQSAIAYLDEASREAFVAMLRRSLSIRRIPRATAARSVNVVFWEERPSDASVLDELVFLCRETNLRLVVISSSPPTAAWAARFDLIHGEDEAEPTRAAPSPRSTASADGVPGVPEVSSRPACDPEQRKDASGG